MEKFKAVLDLHLKHTRGLFYSLVTLLTAGGERIFSTVVFQCPCSANWNLSYGLVFLLVPALALFLLGYLLSAHTWRLLTGCCASDARAKGFGVRGALVCGQISLGATLAPFTWVAVALLAGSFYECAASGSEFLAQHLCKGRDITTCSAWLPQVPCNKDPQFELQDLQKDLKAQSQVLGWGLIAAVIIIILISTSVIRCWSPVSFWQLKFWEMYVEKEEEILKSEAVKHATELAKENVKCFFEGSHPKDCNTPSAKDWQQISTLYTFNSKKQYYSLLHKYVNRKDKNNSTRSSEGDAMIPGFGFVDSFGISNTPES